MVSAVQAYSKEPGLTGHVGKDTFRVMSAGKNIFIEYKGKETKIALNGYAANQVTLKDLNGGQADEVIFMDLQGNSVGGDLRVFTYNDNSFKEVENDKFGNGFVVVPFKKEFLIGLQQHDTLDLYYVSELVEFKGGKLESVKYPEAWETVIQDYFKQSKNEKTDFGKGRIFSYIFMAYKNIGLKDKAAVYYEKAKKIDPQNPFLE
jgi:hypothetical protein